MGDDKERAEPYHPSWIGHADVRGPVRQRPCTIPKSPSSPWHASVARAKACESGMSSREALREIGSGRSSSKHWRTCGPWSRLASVLGLARHNRQTRCRARCNPAAVLPQAIAVQALRRVAVSRLQLPHGGFHFVLEGLPFLRLGRLERIER